MRHAGPLFDLFTGPEFFATSRFIRHLTNVLDDDEVELSVDQNHRFRLSGRFQEEWVEDLRPGRVVRLAQFGRAWEWFVGDLEEGLDPRGGERVTVTLQPLHIFLANIGPFEDTIQGGATFINNGAFPITARQYFETFIRAHANRHGIAELEAGTFDSGDEKAAAAWEGKNPWQIGELVGELFDLETYLSRDESGAVYLFNQVSEIGEGAATPWADEALNVLRLRRRRRLADMRSVIRVIGGLPAGSARESDIGDHVLIVTAKPGTDEIVVELPGVLGNIIAEENQWADVFDEDSNLVSPAHYLELADGTLTPIIGSDPDTQTFYVADGSHAAVGDAIRIVRDVYGTLITEIPSPSALSSFGRRVGVLTLPDTGERNYARNGLFVDGPASPLPVWSGRFNGAQSAGTSYVLEGLPAGETIPDESTIVFDTGSPRIVVGDTSIDGSGNATVTVHSAGPAVSDNDWLLIFAHPGSEPDGWAAAQGAGATAAVAPVFRTVNPAAPTSGTLNGAVATLATQIVVDGVTPSDGMIPAGTRVEIAGESYGAGTQAARVVLNDTPVVGGAATLIVTPRILAGPTADNSAVTFIQPETPAAAGGLYEIGFPMHAATGVGWESDPFLVRHIEGLETLVVTAAFFLANESNPTTGTITVTSTTTPRLKLIRQDGGPTNVVNVPLVASSPADDVAIAGQAEHAATLQGTYETPEGESPELTVRFEPTREASGGGFVQLAAWQYLQSVTAYLTTDLAAPPISYAGANKLIQRGQIALADAKAWGATYEVDLLELAEVLRTGPENIRVELGGYIQIGSPTLGTFTLLRVTALRWVPSRPENVTLVLERSPASITAETRRARARRQFARFNITIAGVEIDETVTTDDAPALDVTGTRRAGVVGVGSGDSSVIIGEVP